jgi:hypothetical protein
VSVKKKGMQTCCTLKTHSPPLLIITTFFSPLPHNQFCVFRLICTVSSTYSALCAQISFSFTGCVFLIFSEEMSPARDGPGRVACYSYLYRSSLLTKY